MDPEILSPSAALESAGLSDPEIQVYLALLSLGSQPASIVAKKAGLKRGHTYNVLALLIRRGIVQEFEKDSVRYFTCCRPAGLLSVLERRSEEIDVQKRNLLKALPLLELIRNPLALQPKVRFFQGMEGIKEIYEESLRTQNQNLYALGDFDHYFPRERSPELNDWMWKYCKRRAERGIWYLGIVNKSPTTDLAFRKRRAEKRKFKMLQGIDLPVEVNIYGNKVAIISSSKDMVGLIIEDQPTADTLRNFHRAMWELLPDYTL
jgi:sugar-specific transcriptional regulator TrmB